MFAFIVLGFIFSVLRQEIGYEERLQNGLVSFELAIIPLI